jgi:hypothetical protein
MSYIDKPWDDRSELEIKYKELEAKNAELEKKLEIAVEALGEAWKLLENSEHCKYADKAYYIVDKALAAINGEGV